MYLYQVIREKQYNVDIGAYFSFGIKIYYIKDRVVQEACTISDISIDEKKIRELAAACNIHQLSPLHIFDVIEDFLS